ncbi:hypothetical protein O1611_g1685 [Lasiodiplodia mahajangana]|uniref:Uncharacterized protein n=1 Tax=Lasiodiplodia mahajangana TaxID=1108764 RepID=A0ACC2JWY3_9PEZI|nr:hypothetical protein O1611_g1685 [Lasiodiplodia mahajangana]
MVLFADMPFGLAAESGCPGCYPKLQPQTQLLRCSGCKVVHYCGAGHQKEHWPKHKAACTSIVKSRKKEEKEIAKLRAMSPEDLFGENNVFEAGTGSRFWGLMEPRDYMRAQFAAADALLQIDTTKAVEEALAYFQDMLRMCPSDNLNVRDIIPGLLLRLEREQECYDFLKWWGAIDHRHHLDGPYNWRDFTPHIHEIRGDDAFEAVDAFAINLKLSQLAILALLKLRLYLDVEPYDPQYMDFDSPWFSWPPPLAEFMRPIGEIVRKKIGTITSSDVPKISESLKGQYKALFRMVHKRNPHFWAALVDASEDTPSWPSTYSCGSIEEATVSVYRCKKAWEESYDAIMMIESEIVNVTEVYKGPAIALDGVNTGEIAVTSERRRGSGRVFPSKFCANAYPDNLFPPSRTGQGQVYHFVHRNNQEKALAYADGACSDNGQQNPQAAWAVVLRSFKGGKIRPCMISGRLELKGPFGDETVATSNRAELRAAIAALRCNDWRADGFTSVVIATDSSYLVNSATEWVRNWVRNGWKTRAGGSVKNQDLWELFLGEVEKCRDGGLEVELWKIPREMNRVADALAKETIHKGAPLIDFEGNIPLGSFVASTTASKEPRVLCLCLEYDGIFNGLYASLISRITAKAKMDRATTEKAALDMLTQTPPPSVIFITDGGVTKIMKVWERVIDCLRGGSTVVLAACFSSLVNEGQFNRCFAKIGLPWKRGEYHRTNVSLRPGVVDDRLKTQLLPTYSQKALYVQGVARSDVWYAGERDEVAVAFTKVGNGMLGYVGDVNGEDGSEAVVLAMLGLLN